MQTKIDRAATIFLYYFMNIENIEKKIALNICSMSIKILNK